MNLVNNNTASSGLDAAYHSQNQVSGPAENKNLYANFMIMGRPYRLPLPGNYAKQGQSIHHQQNSRMVNVAERLADMLQQAISMLQQTFEKLFNALAEQQPPIEQPIAEEPSPSPAPLAPQAPQTPAEPCSCDSVEKEDKLKTNLGKSGEFLWKPASEKDGKLVILIPSKFTGNVKNVRIVDAAGNSIAKGKASGVANGNREHFRFDKAGKAYLNGSFVEITLKSGEVKRVKISDTANRLQR